MHKEQHFFTINIEYTDWHNNVHTVTFNQSENSKVLDLLLNFFGTKSTFLAQLINCNQPLHKSIAELSKNNNLDLKVSLSRPYITDLRNPVKNIQEYQRLITTLQKEKADVIILGIGTFPVSKGSEYQTDPAFGRELRAMGHSVQIFNIDPQYQEQKNISETSFGLAVDPDYIMNSKLINLIKQKSAEGKKFIIFDNTATNFSDFTYALGKKEAASLRPHEDIEFIIGHGLGAPLIMLSWRYFDLFPSGLGLTSFKDSEDLRLQTNCLTFQTDKDIPVNFLFDHDPVFQILSALERLKKGIIQGNSEFYRVFLTRIRDVRTVDQLYDLLPILDAACLKKIVHFGDRAKFFFGQDVYAMEKLKNKMCLALTRVLADPQTQVDHTKLKTLCERLDYSSDRTEQIFRQARSP